jgi:mannan endo-1,4-beta-mannosidase
VPGNAKLSFLLNALTISTSYVRQGLPKMNFCCGRQKFQISPEQEQQDKEYFVKLENQQLSRNGKVFKFASFNVPGLLMMEDRAFDDNLYGFPICQLPVSNPSVDKNGYYYGTENDESCIIPKPSDKLPPKKDYAWVPPAALEQEDAILSIKGAEGRVIRTYCLGFGPRHHVTGLDQYYEPAWVAFDNALALCRTHGVKLIVPIINNHCTLGAGYFGDYISLCQFRNLPASQFYKNPILRQDMKDIIMYMLNRTNTVNGIKYCDDSSILAWQLGNELCGWDGPVNMDEYLDWVFDISTFIKTLAPNTLVADGTLGGRNASKRFLPQLLQYPALDIFSNHYYHGDEDLNRINVDSKLVASYGKAFLCGEFGFEDRPCIKVFNQVLANSRVSGALIWSLRYHSRDGNFIIDLLGGFYTHQEDGGYYSFHIPGFQSNTSDGFGPSELKMAKFVRNLNLKIQNRSTSTQFPTPPSCHPAAGFIQSPNALRWFGSAWASSYQIERKEGDDSSIIIATSVSDNVSTGKVIYNDVTAIPGKKYEYYIKPVSCDGIVNHQNYLCITI